MDMITLVVLFFLGTLILIGLYAKKTADYSASGYLLGGRQLKSFTLGISAAATGNSGFIMLGAVGLGYQFGISFIALPLAWLIGDLVFWKYFPHKMNKASRLKNVSTVPSLLSISATSYQRGISLFSSLIMLLALGIYTASQFSAITKASSFVGFDNAELVIAFTVFIVLVYTTPGGFKSSVLTDLFQALFMFLVPTVVLVDVFMTNGGVVSTFSNLLDTNPSHLNIVGFPLQPAFLSILAFFAGWVCASLGFGLSQPQVISRYFAGNSELETKKAKWVYILFLQYTWIGMTLFGILSNTVISSLDDPELAVMKYAALYNEFFVALVFVGILSAVISTLDSAFVSIGGVVSEDILSKRISSKYDKYKYFRPAIVVCFAIIVAVISMSLSKTVFELSALAVTFMTATIAPAMAYVILKESPCGRAILAAMISGALAFCLWNTYGTGKLEFDALIGFMTGASVIWFIDRLNLTKASS